MPDMSCLPFTLYLPITFALLSLLKPILIPREVLTDLVAAVGLGEAAGAIGVGSEIERLKGGIGDKHVAGNIALTLEDAEVGAVHDHKTAVSTREDVETPAV